MTAEQLTRACIQALAIAAISSAAHAASIELPANHDATIYENNSDNGSGAGNGLFAGTNGTKSPRRALISFNLAALPVDAIVQSVELTLYLGQAAGMGGGGSGGVPTATIDLRRIAAPWGEGATLLRTPPTDSLALVGQGEPAEEGDVTWSSSFSYATAPISWTVPGGAFGSTASSSLTIGTTINVPYAWPSTSAMVSDVQGWLSHPEANHGWMLVNQDETTTATFRAFYSREVATELYHPKLTVNFTAPPALTADLDNDQHVDGADFLTWQRGLGILTGAARQTGDATSDGAVTALDLASWKQQWSAATPTVAAAPEPATFSLGIVALCGAAMAARTQRHLGC